MPDRKEKPGVSLPLPTERGSKRFPWKSVLATTGLTLAGTTAGFLIFNPIDAPIDEIVLSSLGVGIGMGIGFGTGIFLTSGLNVFKEDVISLLGNGQLHPKSPSLLSNKG